MIHMYLLLANLNPHSADVCDQFMHNLLEEKKEGEVLWARGY